MNLAARWVSGFCAWNWLAWLSILIFVGPLGCRKPERPLEPRSITWAELRVVRSGVTVTPPGEAEREPYARERLADGARLHIAAEGLAWIRRDAGATLLVRGPAELILRAKSVEITAGRVFLDSPPDTNTELETPRGALALTNVRTSVDVLADGTVRAYVLSGEARSEKARALAGEALLLKPNGAPEVTPVAAFDDWTGGLATTDRAAAPAPFGVGTVGARKPGEQGAPRFPLAIQRLAVHVTFEGDFAITEVDQTFFNPSSDTVEGMYGFRTPEGATLERFGVDREGVVVWGHVKERAAAAAQYQQNVYQGSTEDPALLEWDAPGSYKARLYPIAAGTSRRVVVRYAEWLGRTGAHAERRLYVYPMAAEGSEASLPHVEELTVAFDLEHVGAKEVRSGMAGVRQENTLYVRRQDFVPRADLALELFDDGPKAQRAYRAKHAPDLDVLPPADRDDAAEKAKKEADYLLVPLRRELAARPAKGLDLAIVIDASAATDAASLAIARAATRALITHLGDSDRLVIWAGDEGLRPVVAGQDKPAKVDEALRQRVLTELGRLERGGASDLGAMIAEAAAGLDPTREQAVVYIGDGAATVGELSLGALRERLAKSTHPTRLFALGVGDGAHLDVLSGLAAGGFAERIGDANQAARAALRVLEDAERPAWLGVHVDLGPSVERVFPRDPEALLSEQTLLVVGRLAGSATPNSVKLTGDFGARELPLELTTLEDHGDLRRRWAEARLAQMLRDGEGRAAMVDLGVQSGILTPVTSFYVPTKNEMSPLERAEFQARRDQLLQSNARTSTAGVTTPLAAQDESTIDVDRKEGGTGTRAKGEEGSMGAPTPQGQVRYAVRGPADNAPMRGLPAAPAAAAAPVELAPEKPMGGNAMPAVETAKPSPVPSDGERLAKDDTQEFGMIGILDGKAVPGAAATAAASATAPPPDGAKSVTALDAIGAAGLGLRGAGAGGGGRWGDKISESLGNIGTIGHGDSAGEGFGNGQRNLKQSMHAPTLQAGALRVAGRLPAEVIQRIVRQNFGRFRLCYENGLAHTPELRGALTVGFIVGRDGSVINASNESSTLPDAGVIRCVVSAFQGLSFPQPEGGNVTVSYPISFAPGSGSSGAGGALSGVSVSVRVGELPRVLLGCSAAADVSLAERVILWRERLQRAGGDPSSIANVYRSALADCEAPTWRERTRLLGLLLDAIPSVTGQVQLWREMFRDLGANDVIYRGILARVRTPAQMAQLHAALGLKAMDPALLARAIHDAKSPGELVKTLRAMSREWPDDFALALAFVDALEDARDIAGARAEARRLRARPDADAHLRTSVGELYLRLAAASSGEADKSALTAEARRAFGEIVEFSPDDPVARRRLGDLLCAHGWYADARRQYETLQTLAPDDPNVALLLASAAEGQGLLDEALKWAEKGSGVNAPDSVATISARALEATYLAWGRAAAREGKRAKELEALDTRSARVLAATHLGAAEAPGVRVSLTWLHPEFHPTLWSNALGAPMPASEGDPILGVAQVKVPTRTGAYVEVRLEPSEVEHMARLGAEARLTAVFDELGEHERVVDIPVRFARGGPSSQRFAIADGEVRHD